MLLGKLASGQEQLAVACAHGAKQHHVRAGVRKARDQLADQNETMQALWCEMVAQLLTWVPCNLVMLCMLICTHGHSLALVSNSTASSFISSGSTVIMMLSISPGATVLFMAAAAPCRVSGSTTSLRVLVLANTLLATSVRPQELYKQDGLQHTSCEP